LLIFLRINVIFCRSNVQKVGAYSRFTDCTLQLMISMTFITLQVHSERKKKCNLVQFLIVRRPRIRPEV